MLAMSSTQLSTFYECERKWFLTYVKRRTKPQSDAMRKGSLFHRIFELYFRDNMSLDDIIEKVRDDHQDWAHMLPVVMPLFFFYLEKNKKKEFVLINDKPAIELEFTLELAEDFILRGKIDYIQQIGSKKYITDIKVTSMSLTDWYFMQFELGVQPMLYSYVGEEFLSGIEGFMIDGVMHSKAGKIDNNQQFFPLLGNREEFISEVCAIGSYVNANIQDESAFPHRYTSCIGKYGKCNFFDVCRAPKHRQEAILMSDDFIDYVSIYKETK